MIRPGLTGLAAQYSTEPLPLPMRTSVGLVVTGCPEDADPHAAGTLHVARDGAASSLDLARVDAIRLLGLEAVGSEIQGRALAGATPLMRPLCCLRNFVRFGCNMCNLRTGLAALELRVFATATAADPALFIFRCTAFRCHRIVLHDLTLEDPNLDATNTVGRVGFGRAIIDVGTQACASGTRPSRYHSVRAISAPPRRPPQVIRITLGAQTHGRLHGALHGTAKCHTAF